MTGRDETRRAGIVQARSLQGFEMMRIVRRPAAAAAGVIGIVLASGTVQVSTVQASTLQASTARAYGPACAAPIAAASGGRVACRPGRVARRPVRTDRRLVADARVSAVDAGAYGVGRYVSLLILGVGY